MRRAVACLSPLSPCGSRAGVFQNLSFAASPRTCHAFVTEIAVFHAHTLHCLQTRHYHTEVFAELVLVHKGEQELLELRIFLAHELRRLDTHLLAGFRQLKQQVFPHAELYFRFSAAKVLLLCDTTKFLSKKINFYVNFIAGYFSRCHYVARQLTVLISTQSVKGRFARRFVPRGTEVIDN